MILPADDLGFLDSEYSGRWEKLSDGAKTGLKLRNYRLPKGYTPEESDLMLLIPDTYPSGTIDMFYFSPPVQRQDGRAIGTLADEIHFGQNWQRWSRHYTWVPGVHCVATHIQYVENALLDELQRG